QSFMIAGLLSNSSNNSIDKTPGVGDLPILGSLFRSTNYQKGETELVIVVTPYLVNPVNAADIKLPTDGYNTPNELQRLFGNMDGDGKSGGSRPTPSSAPDAATNPEVGLNEPSSSQARKSSKRDKRSAANVPAPGFSLK
ncbi:MAG: secretion system protein, partial [Novosphingobium sp.]|nr:secretion system protein [Novosphingobium sp.]